jgi:hypothetical protein
MGSVQISEGARLLGKAIRHPGRAALRLLLRARVARSDPEAERQRLLAFLSRQFGVDALGLYREYVGSEFRRWFADRQVSLRKWSGPLRMGTTDAFGCEALYLLVRAARPRCVVETGVLYGAASSHLLAALKRNGEGELHSIELTTVAGEPPLDFLVPTDLRDGWNLIMGDSRRELPAVLARQGAVDLFHHDSLHTFEHMTWEFDVALRHLTAGGILSSDDVLIAHSLREIFSPNAFPVFCGRNELECSTFLNFGIALRDGARTLGMVEESRGR